jgi:hypothetical protein
MIEFHRIIESQSTLTFLPVWLILECSSIAERYNHFTQAVSV